LAQYNLRGPYKREVIQVGGGVMTEAGCSNVRKGPRAKECRSLWKLRKAGKWILPQNASGGTELLTP